MYITALGWRRGQKTLEKMKSIAYAEGAALVRVCFLKLRRLSIHLTLCEVL